MNVQINDLLKKNKLKRTKLRLALLNFLQNSNSAKSYSDIKKALGANVDKSTLYRNLTAFEEAGLIHHVNDQSGMAKYAFGKLHNHGRDHAHFVCENCGTIYCIEKTTTKTINVPKGFKAKDIQTIINGICSDC